MTELKHQVIKAQIHEGKFEGQDITIEFRRREDGGPITHREINIKMNGKDISNSVRYLSIYASPNKIAELTLDLILR